MEKVVEDLGVTVVVVTRDGAWLVPRHYAALHGIKAAELPELAEKYGFEKSPVTTTIVEEVVGQMVHLDARSRRN